MEKFTFAMLHLSWISVDGIVKVVVGCVAEDSEEDDWEDVADDDVDWVDVAEEEGDWENVEAEDDWDDVAVDEVVWEDAAVE